MTDTTTTNSSHDGIPIPKGWSRGISQTLKRPYYFHRESKHTQWHFPTPAEASDPVGTKRRMLEERATRHKSSSSTTNATTTSNLSSIAIIVPYRDLHPTQNRAKHLHSFIPHMKSFLTELITLNKIQDYHIDHNRAIGRSTEIQSREVTEHWV